MKKILLLFLFCGWFANSQTLGVTDFTLASDNASNYSSFSTGQNLGTGFGAWTLDTTTPSGGFAGFFVASSPIGASSLDTGGKSFGMYANSANGTVAGATRPFPKAMQAADAFSIKVAVNYRDGNKGFDLRDASNATIANFNVSGDTYVLAGTTLFSNNYDSNTVFTFTFTQNANNTLSWTVVRSGGSTGTQSGTIASVNSGTITNIRLYNVSAGTNGDGGNGARNLYFNSLSFTSKYSIPSPNAVTVSAVTTVPYLNIYSGASVTVNSSIGLTSNGLISGAGSLTANGSLQLNSGCTMTGNLNINGSIIISSGGYTNTAPTYGASSSLIYRTGGSYGRSTEWSTTSGAGYPNNVTIDSGTTLDLSSGGDVDRAIGGTLTLGGNGIGNLTMGSMTKKLTVNKGVFVGAFSDAAVSTLTLSSNSASSGLEIGGNFRIAGNSKGVYNDNGRGTFFINSGNATISDDLAGSTLNTFTYLFVNKTGGGNVTAGTDIQVNSILTLNAQLITGTYKIIIPATASITANTGGWVNGNLQKGITTAGAAFSKTFEIGDNNSYAPVFIQNNGAAATGLTVTASTSAGDHANIAGSGIDASKSVNRTWTLALTPGAVFTAYDATFTFPATDVDNTASTGSFVVRRYDSGTWSAPSATGQTATSTKATGLSSSSFGTFQIGNANPLAVNANPSGSSICAGTNATFSSSSTSTPTPTVHWEEKTPSGSFTTITNGGVYSGATTGTLTITGATTAMSGNQYRAVFSNINGDVTSTAATLTVTANVTYYADSDADGFGNPSVSQTTCTGAPSGYVLDSTDCNDAVTYYQDLDGDGFGSSVKLACGTVTNNTDCNDAVTYYQDLDGDGFGSSVKLACGTVTNNTDCNDNQVLYADADGDGYGSTTKVACAGVANNTDCNDNSNAAYQTLSFYVDADGDGYGAGAGQAVCAGATTPSGYSTNNTDCNDNAASAHPGAVEIGYNLIDDDCDGLVDEGFPPKNTTLTGSMCSLTLPALDTQLYADVVAGAQGYQWRITTVSGTNTGQVQLLNTSLRVMKLTQLASYAYATGYKVEVAVYYAGYLQPYTVSNCTVNTPAITTTLAACGQTLTTMGDVVYANNIPYVTGYRFRITDPQNAANAQTLDRAVREFRMNLVTAFQVKFNKQYTIEVALKNTTGEYLPYGSPCSVTTPVFPTSSIQDEQCADYAPANTNTSIYAYSYPGAIAYGFNLSGNNFGTAGVEVVKTTRTFRLSDFAGLVPGATYNVRVRLIFNYSDPAGLYGKTCTVTVPGAAKATQAEQPQGQAPFEVTAYPNPFQDGFGLELQTASREKVGVRVYDMTGRLLDTLTTDTKESGQAQIGRGYPSGVYNVVVTQGDQVKTVRVVKR